MSSTVFPVGCMGCKEELSGEDIKNSTSECSKEEDETLKKRPSSTESRNPVTGVGMNSNDEIRKTNSGRPRDGNPVLGIGYGNDEDNSQSTNKRIPPGGYSKGLW